MEWDKLRKMMWSENCTISPGGFITAIQKVAKIKKKRIFTGHAQNDLPEFVIFLIDCFHASILREVEMTIKGNVITEKDKLAKKCFHMLKVAKNSEEEPGALKVGSGRLAIYDNFRTKITKLLPFLKSNLSMVKLKIKLQLY